MLRRRIWLTTCRTALLIFVISFCSVPLQLAAQPTQEGGYAEARRRMVQEEIIDAGIRDPRVHAAMGSTPRHEFVAPSQRKFAYFDIAMPIGSGQTISPPFVVAYMTEQLQPKSTDKVLEIGTGSGYQAAVLSPIVAEVYSIEIVEQLGKTAAETLRRLNYKNVHTKVGDGFLGWPEHAPFDKIIVTCSPENVPPALVEQLRDGGRMVVPLGERYEQTLYLMKKENGVLKTEALEPTFFVPMTGKAEEARVKKNDTGLPELLNGSFESVAETDTPAGWYYVRQATVEEDRIVPDGKKLLRFRNETLGRGAQALQSMAMDGRKVKEVEISLWVSTRNVQAGLMAPQVPHVDFNFFDDLRAHVGTVSVGQWKGTMAGSKRTHKVKIPPKSRLAVMAIGMFGATGEFSVDNISLRVLSD